MRRSREMGLAGMSHQPCRDQKTTDPEKPSFPSLPHRCSLSRRGAGETCPRQGAFQAHGGDRILAASADYYAVDPLPPVEKKRRGARSADSSSVHYRRSSVHIRRETRPKTGSTDRFREPHAPSDPGTHTTASLSLSLLLSPLLAPRSLQAAFPPRYRAPRRYRYLFPAGWKRRLPRLGHEIHGCGPQSLLTYAIFQAWDASSRYASSRINVITGEILHRTERDTVEGLNSIRFSFFFSNE